MTNVTLEFEISTPPAHAMIESLRGVGYSLETAVADLIDNSIAAGASNAWLDFHFDGAKSRFTLLDDGRGMDADALRIAMTLGGRSPLEPRTAKDLGRFGMGLKTASFSQCRVLTVASRQAFGEPNVRRWDLDYIARSDVNEWRLLCDAAEGSAPYLEVLQRLPSGTLVLWERMDRITAGLSADRKGHSAFLTMVARVEQHLAMVFHRYLEGSAPRLRLHIGNTRIKPWDPFLLERQTPFSPIERISGPDGLVELQGFVLPHRDQLDPETHERAGGRDGWTSQQGFYIYRNDRMLVAGGWLGLGEPRAWTREEPFKLARLAVSFGNAADQDWSIDIKKSTARPPRAIRARLTALATAVRNEARRVFAHRGAYGPRAATKNIIPVWLASSTKAGTAYRLNHEHPSLRQVRDAVLGDGQTLENFLKLVETNVPVQRIWLDAMEQSDSLLDSKLLSPEEQESIETIAAGILKHLTQKVGLSRPLAIAQLRVTEPFQNYSSIIDRIESAPEPAP